MNYEDKSKQNLEEGLVESEKNLIQNEEKVDPIEHNNIEKSPNDDENNKNTEVSTSDKIQETKIPLKKCLFVELKNGVSYFNLFSYYLTQFSYVCACTFIDACQDYLLESKDYYDIDKTQVGSINGDILLFDTLFLILFIYIYGSFHDIFGRKIMVVYGFISMAISLFLHPLAGNIYPNLILIRLIFANGICAVTTQPLLADYVSHRTKGFGGGIASVVSGLGAIFAVTVLIKLQSYTSLLYVYWIAAGFSLAAAIITAFGVKNVHKNTVVERNICKRFRDLYVKLKEGLKECGRNVPLRIGIAASSLSRMNTILITLFLVMWVKRHDMKDEDAVHLAHMISGIGNSVGLVSALLFGFMLEKKKTSSFLLISNALIFIGYLGFYLIDDPHSWITIVSISVASFGFYGLMTLGYVMVNQHCGHNARGSVMGINCLFGAIAILIIAKLGGMAFDKINIYVPFLFVGASSLVLFIVILFRRKELDEAKPVGCPVKH